MVSLKNQVAGREWNWHSGDTLEFFANEYGTFFGDSTYAGILGLDGDRCFYGSLRSTWICSRRSPFTLQRGISISGSTIRLDYTLQTTTALI